MGYGIAPNCNHFTGKKKRVKSLKKKKLRKKVTLHKNKYKEVKWKEK